MFEGTIIKRKDGRIELRVKIGTRLDGTAVKKSFYGKSEREAKKKRDEWLTQNPIYKQNIANNSVSFSEWADRWLEVYKKGNVREYTYENTYCSRVRKYLKPYFKERPLQSIRPIDIREFFNLYRYLSIDLLKTLKIILNDIFEKAIENDICTKNPVLNIKLKSTYKQKKKKALNLEEYERAVQWAIETEHIDILTVLKTGIRRGELLGLRWCDIDFEKKVIKIEQSIGPPAKSGKGVDFELKSLSSNRSIPIDEELAENLNKLPKTSELVFQTYNANAYGKRIKKPLLQMAEDCNLPFLTLHELRHTYGTVLREKGVDIYSISKLLGHASIEVTAKIYVHNDLEVLRSAIEGKDFDTYLTPKSTEKYREIPTAKKTG